MKRKKRFALAALLVPVIIALLGILGMGLYISFKNRTNGSLMSGGIERRYLVHVPGSSKKKGPVPLVICFHGLAEWPEHRMSVTGWNRVADREGFIVVYPSGTGIPRRWKTFAIPGQKDSEPAIDLAFIRDLVAHLSSRYPIDTARVYVNGHSNGAGMSHLASCALSDIIAAMGGVAGAYPLENYRCAPSRPVPVIAFHGTDDPVVPYGGGSFREFQLPSAESWIAFWAQRNDCTSSQSGKVSANVTYRKFGACRQSSDAILYTVRGGGHTWPGGEATPRWLTGPTNNEINATELMWEFFKQHPCQGCPQRGVQPL